MKHQPWTVSVKPNARLVEVGSSVVAFKGELWPGIGSLIFSLHWGSKDTRPNRCCGDRGHKGDLLQIGVPNMLRSEIGPCYDCSAFRSFSGSWNIQTMENGPRYLRSAGVSSGVVTNQWELAQDPMDDHCEALGSASTATHLELSNLCDTDTSMEIASRLGPMPWPHIMTLVVTV